MKNLKCGRTNVLAMKAEAVDECRDVGTGIRLSIRELTNPRLSRSDVRLSSDTNPSV